MYVETTWSPIYTKGWIHNSVVSVIVEAYSRPIAVFSLPDLDSKVVYEIPLDRKARVISADNKFAKIRCLDDDGNEIVGYVRRNDLCGNPYTTCG